MGRLAAISTTLAARKNVLAKNGDANRQRVSVQGINIATTPGAITRKSNDPNSACVLFNDLRGTEKMARPERFELPTYWFEASRSIQLS